MHDQPTECLVIVPSSRAARKLERIMAGMMGQSGWLPEVKTLNDVLRHSAGLSTLDPLAAQAELFSCWRALQEGGDEPEASSDSRSFQSFMPWGRIALRDFNEIDQHMLEASQVFQNLCDIEGIEEWSFADEKNLGSAQRSFLKQYLQLGPLYQAFQKRLLDHGLGYAGLIARIAAQKQCTLDYSHVFVAGLSALTPSERKFLRQFESKNQLTWLWDGDESYVLSDEIEAGLFIREQGGWGTGNALNALSNRLSKSPPTIHSVACSSAVMECQYVREVLESIHPEDWSKTAVVLPDGSQLPLLLQSLPAGMQAAYNVTMGLSWNDTPAHSFLQCVRVMAQKSTSAWHISDLQQLFGESLTRQALKADLLQADALNVLQAAAKRKWAWLSDERLNDQSLGTVAPFCAAIGKLRAANAGELLEALTEWSRGIAKSLESAEKPDPWSSVGWERVMRAVGLMRRFQEEFGLLKTASEVWSILFSSLSTSRIDLLGEPEEGLQIMGLIESRALDFERVILLDCNEGSLPKTSVPDSFIPFDLRAVWELPNRHHKEAIYAYYTYRLFNEAKDVHMVYRSEDESSEKSRYLLQVERAFRPNGKDLLPLEKTTVFAPLPDPRPEIAPIIWDEFARERLEGWAQRGISPSALNSFMACKRNFYYQYILRLSEPREFTEEMNSSTFGTIVHQVLEDGLSKMLDQPMTRELLLHFKQQITPYLQASVEKHFNRELTSFGENYLHLTIAEATLVKLIGAEMAELEKDQTKTIGSLEARLGHTFQSDHPHFPEVRIHGMADRIDTENGTVVVTDYKTGAVEARELKLKEPWTDKLDDGKSDKALQLLMYAAIAVETIGPNGKERTDTESKIEHVRAGIRSGKNANAGLLPLSIDGQTFVTRQDALKLLQWISQKLTDLHQTDAGLVHETESKYCAYCTVLDPLPEYF
jgi:RecB family exonuclease